MSIDRSVISKKHPDARRPTTQEINTLKFKVVSSEQVKKPLSHKLSNIIQSILHYCTFTVAKKNNSQCKIYGHVLSPKVQGEQFFCGECGEKVTSPEQLRASSRSASQNRSDTGSWR